jgi:hypothetical protein
MTDPRRLTPPATTEPGPDVPGEDGSGPRGAPAAPVDYEPPWREARRRVAVAWGRGRAVTRAAIALGGILAAVLLGAFLFGLWHVVVGGFLKGNWNAGGFGIALASVAGVLLWIEAAIARRLLPPADAGPRAAGPRAAES